MREHIIAELTDLVREESRYASELWTVLQEVRLWAAENGYQLPDCARSNRRDFLYERFDAINERHFKIDALIERREVH
jgi:hypothetical protein